VEDKSLLPPAALSYLEGLLHGESDQDVGFDNILKRCDRAINCAKKGIANPDFPEQYQKLLLRHVETGQLKNIRNELKQIVDRIELLQDVTSMQEAVSLVEEQFNDQDWRDFLGSALGAYFDYSRHREKAEKAKDLAKKISSAATKLAKLIDDLKDLKIDNQPAELHRIEHLLARTENEEFLNSKFDEWKKVKSNLFGELEPGTSRLHQTGNRADLHPFFYIYQEELFRTFAAFQIEASDSEAYTGGSSSPWYAAPSIPSLLRNLAISASEYKPAYTGAVGAATLKQKPHPEFEFVRAWGHILANASNIPLSNKVIRAMTVVANILLHDKERFLTDGDVRYALNEIRAKSTPPAHSK